jgi:hypothetical protein
MTDDASHAALARQLAELQGVPLNDADAAMCGRLLVAGARALAPPLAAACAERPEGMLFDVPPGAHAAVLRGEGA